MHLSAYLFANAINYKTDFISIRGLLYSFFILVIRDVTIVDGVCHLSRSHGGNTRDFVTKSAPVKTSAGRA